MSEDALPSLFRRSHQVSFPNPSVWAPRGELGDSHGVFQGQSDQYEVLSTGSALENRIRQNNQQIPFSLRQALLGFQSCNIISVKFVLSKKSKKAKKSMKKKAKKMAKKIAKKRVVKRIPAPPPAPTTEPAPAPSPDTTSPAPSKDTSTPSSTW